MAIYLARHLSGMSGIELGAFFDVSGAAVTMRYNQVCRDMNENKKLDEQVQEIKKQLLNS